MYQQIENDVSVRAKKDNGLPADRLATDLLSLFSSSGRKLKVFCGFFALRF